MYTRLLVPIDGSATARLALSQAGRLAQLCGATVELLHVIEVTKHTKGFETPRAHLDSVRPRFLALGNALLDEARQALEPLGIEVDTVLLESRGSRVAQVIVERARQTGADLIVLGTHGRRGVGRVLLGSDAEQVARTASVPVMLIRAEAREDADAP